MLLSWQVFTAPVICPVLCHFQTCHHGFFGERFVLSRAHKPRTTKSIQVCMVKVLINLGAPWGALLHREYFGRLTHTDRESMMHIQQTALWTNYLINNCIDRSRYPQIKRPLVSRDLALFCVASRPYIHALKLPR